jgi:hypothetical protein
MFINDDAKFKENGGIISGLNEYHGSLSCFIYTTVMG